MDTRERAGGGKGDGGAALRSQLRLFPESPPQPLVLTASLTCFIRRVRNAQGRRPSQEGVFWDGGVHAAPRFEGRYGMTRPVPLPGCKGQLEHGSESHLSFSNGLKKRTEKKKTLLVFFFSPKFGSTHTHTHSHTS